MSDKTSYLHFLDADWIKENSASFKNGNGLPFTNRFVCLLNAPSSNELKNNAWLELQVLSADVPNFSIEPTELELNGARRFFFKGRGDGELGITFLDTPGLLLRRFFYEWMEKAIRIDQGSGVRRGYMNEYMPSPSEFIIFPLDYEGKSTFADRFTNVFPYDISGVSYNYAQAGEVIKTTVKFKYMYHYLADIRNKKSYHLSEKVNYEAP